MSQIDLIKQALAAIEAGDLDKVAAMATEGMQFDGPVPDAIGTQALVKVSDADAGHPASSAQSASTFTIQSNCCLLRKLLFN